MSARPTGNSPFMSIAPGSDERSPLPPPTVPGYTPIRPGSPLLVPGGTPPPSVPPTQTVSVPIFYESPGGEYQGTRGYAQPQERILPILIQRLLGNTDFYASAPRLNFPFVIRSISVWAPALTIGASSDGTISLVTTLDPANTAAAYNAGQPILPIGQGDRAIYCPSIVSLGGLWMPYPEGHLGFVAHCLSAAAATNILCVCVIGITPLDDLMETQ
jgi:hypothetical protein